MRRVLTVTLGLILLVATTPSANALCAFRTPAELFSAADLVVEGAVRGTGISLSGGFDVTVAPEHVYRGTPPSPIIIHDTNGPATASVDVPFQQGARYLLFLRSENGAERFTTDICMGSRALDASGLTAAEQLALGSGSAISRASATTVEAWKVALPLTVIAAGVAFSLWLRRRRAVPEASSPPEKRQGDDVPLRRAPAARKKVVTRRRPLPRRAQHARRSHKFEQKKSAR